MLTKKLTAFFLFWAVICCCTAARAQPGKPVQYLTVKNDPDKNIIRVLWDPQDGVTEYTVERWEARGTDYWYFGINNKIKPQDTLLKIKNMELEPVVFIHPANSGKYIEMYDENVKPSHTYFYRVNRGNVFAAETKSRKVVPLSESEKEEIRVRSLGGQRQNLQEEGSAPKTWMERAKEQEKNADYPERMAADLLMAIPKWLVDVIQLSDPLELVFEIDLEDTGGPGKERPVKSKDLILNTFDKEEFEVVSDFYTSAKEVAPVFMVVGVVIAGVLVLFKSTGPEALRSAKGYIAGILLCAVLLKLGPYLLGFFFDINRAVVALCYGVVADDIRQSILHTIYNEETRSLGSAVMALIACLSIGVVNFQFAMRKVFIAILVGILPIVLINAIYPGRRNALMIWIREFISYVFMPAGFAIGLAFFIRFLHSGDFWVTLVCLLSLPAINGLVRGVLGLSDTGLAAGVGSALGMGAFFSLGGMLKGVSGGKEGPAGHSQTVNQGKVDYGAAKDSPVQALGGGAPGIVGSALKGAARVGVAGTMALGGSMLWGAAGGDSGRGLETGLNVGNSLESTISGTVSSIKSFVSEAREKGLTGTAGIADSSMLMDPGVTASLARRVLGDNAFGDVAAKTAATASRMAYAVSPLVAPEARERLDRVTELAGSQFLQNQESAVQAGNLRSEFEKVRQAQNFRQMFSKIHNCRHTGGSGGIHGSFWR
ncbi:MAG: hypothetical protein ACOY30_15225 [Bacillota bacterium]